MLKINNSDIRTTLWRHSGVFIVNFEHISQRILVFLLLTLHSYIFAGVSITVYVFIDNFAHVITNWKRHLNKIIFRPNST